MTIDTADFALLTAAFPITATVTLRLPARATTSPVQLDGIHAPFEPGFCFILSFVSFFFGQTDLQHIKLEGIRTKLVSERLPSDSG